MFFISEECFCLRSVTLLNLDGLECGETLTATSSMILGVLIHYIVRFILLTLLHLPHKLKFIILILLLGVLAVFMLFLKFEHLLKVVDELVDTQLFIEILFLLDLVDDGLVLLVPYGIIMKTLYHLLRIIRLKMVAHAFDGTPNIEFAGVRDFWEPTVRHRLLFSRSVFHCLGLMQSLLGHIPFVKV